jgi:hypothetical protein
MQYFVNLKRPKYCMHPFAKFSCFRNRAINGSSQQMVFSLRCWPKEIKCLLKRAIKRSSVRKDFMMNKGTFPLHSGFAASPRDFHRHLYARLTMYWIKHLPNHYPVGNRATKPPRCSGNGPCKASEPGSPVCFLFGPNECELRDECY